MKSLTISSSVFLIVALHTLMFVSLIWCTGCSDKPAQPKPKISNYYLIVDQVERTTRSNYQAQNAPSGYDFDYTVAVYINNSESEHIHYFTNEYLRTGDTLILWPTSRSMNGTQSYIAPSPVNYDSIHSMLKKSSVNYDSIRTMLDRALKARGVMIINAYSADSSRRTRTNQQ
jgi:hypothetical protein